MSQYLHHVSGFFAHRKQAEGAMFNLVEQGLPGDQLQLLDSAAVSPSHTPAEDSNTVLKDVLVEGAIGTAVGTGLGALAQVALVAGSVSLFVASPLVAPLVMMGWGASLGGLIGAVAGASDTKSRTLSALVGDAISRGQFVVVAETRSERETTLARDAIKASVGDFEDVSAARMEA
jgi:hypothetical protein